MSPPSYIVATPMIENYIVMVGDKIIIPQSFRSTILEKLHLVHQGVQRTKAKARKSLYWPGMARDIEAMVEKCMQCQSYSPNTRLSHSYHIRFQNCHG